MSDRHDHPPTPAPWHAFRFRSTGRGIAANSNDRYDHRLNGHPRGSLPPSRWYPLPVLDPDVDVQLRRAALEVVR